MPVVRRSFEKRFQPRHCCWSLALRRICKSCTCDASLSSCAAIGRGIQSGVMSSICGCDATRAPTRLLNVKSHKSWATNGTCWVIVTSNSSQWMSKQAPKNTLYPSPCPHPTSPLCTIKETATCDKRCRALLVLLPHLPCVYNIYVCNYFI